MMVCVGLIARMIWSSERALAVHCRTAMLSMKGDLIKGLDRWDSDQDTSKKGADH
jgi:hypothetical protein